MKILAITKTVIPLDYDPTQQGFNNWAISIRNQVHMNERPFDVHAVVNETNKILKFHKTRIG